MAGSDVDSNVLTSQAVAIPNPSCCIPKFSDGESPFATAQLMGIGFAELD